MSKNWKTLSCLTLSPLSSFHQHTLSRQCFSLSVASPPPFWLCRLTSQTRSFHLVNIVASISSPLQFPSCRRCSFHLVGVVASISLALQFPSHLHCSFHLVGVVPSNSSVLQLLHLMVSSILTLHGFSVYNFLKLIKEKICWFCVNWWLNNQSDKLLLMT